MGFETLAWQLALPLRNHFDCHTGDRGGAICRHPTAQRFEQENLMTALVVKPICTITQREQGGGGIRCMRTVCKHDTCIQRNLLQRLDSLTMGRSCRTMWSCYKQIWLPTPPTLPTSAIFTSSYLLGPLVRIPKMEKKVEQRRNE